MYICHYESPLGTLLLSADDFGLTGLWFAGQKHYASTLDAIAVQEMNPALEQAVQWLDIYFSGQIPDFSVPVHFIGTEFQVRVWSLLQAIPYGQTITYGQLAKCLDSPKSAQAVGSAVGRNPVSILVPCHRVMGANGQLTGYAAGIQTKEQLLALEQKTCAST